MLKLKEESLDWALKHLQKHPSSDFFPNLFEFDAISNDWSNLKNYFKNLDIEEYCPKTPRSLLAFK